MAGLFTESKHPRGRDGKFVDVIGRMQGMGATWDEKSKTWIVPLSKADDLDGLLNDLGLDAAPAHQFRSDTPTPTPTAPSVIDAEAFAPPVQDGAGDASEALGAVLTSPPPISLEALPDGDMSSARMNHQNGDGTIMIHNDSPRRVAANAFVHEYGHYLDWHSIGTEGEWGMQTEELDPMFQVLKQSPTMKAVRNDEMEALQGDIQFRNYYLSGREMFARAFHQFIAERSQHPVLVEEIEKTRADPYLAFQFWPADEFVPIAQEMEKVLRAHGLLA